MSSITETMKLIAALSAVFATGFASLASSDICSPSTEGARQCLRGGKVDGARSICRWSNDTCVDVCSVKAKMRCGGTPGCSWNNPDNECIRAESTCAMSHGFLKGCRLNTDCQWEGPFQKCCDVSDLVGSCPEVYAPAACANLDKRACRHRAARGECDFYRGNKRNDVPWSCSDVVTADATTTESSTGATAPARENIDCGPYQQNFMDYVWDKPKYEEFGEVIDDVWPKYYADKGVTVHVLNVTSMMYLTPEESNVSTWTHRVMVFVPDVFDEAIKQQAFMKTAGIKSPDESNVDFQEDVAYLVDLTAFTGTVSIFMKDNPNTNVVYTSDPEQKTRTEDQIAVYTWIHYMNNPNDFKWILNLPMTKSVVKVFNAVVDFVKEDQAGLELTNYVLSGVSKRGWSTWLAAAVDDRVTGIAPVVMDMLNMRENLRNHFQSLGGWSYPLSPYYAEGFTFYLDHPEFTTLQCYIDPMRWLPTYLARDIPVYHTGTTGDEFMLLTDAESYLNDARDQGLNIWIRYLHNVQHYMLDHELYQDDLWMSLRVFYSAVANGDWATTLPSYEWNLTQNEDTGSIEVSVDTVDGFTCTSFGADTKKNSMDLDGNRRDFRLLHFIYEAPFVVQTGVFWGSHFQTVVETENVCQVSWPTRDDGWGYRAFYVDLGIELPGGKYVNGRAESRWTISTPANIMPEGLPFDDCAPTGCFGTLV